ncbi:hypothetical protein Tco_1505841 [Tanacetum coccineum]
MKCPQHYLTEMQEVILFYNGLEVPTRQILDSRGKIPTETAADAKVAIQEMEEYSQKWHNRTSKTRRRAAASGFYQRNNANPLYQERRQSMKDTLSKFMSESVKRHEENSNLIKEIRASTDAAIRNQGASIKTLDIQIGQMSMKGSYGTQFSKAYSEASHTDNSMPRKEKDPGIFTLLCFINIVCFDNALVDLGASVSVMPLSTYLNLGLGELTHTKLYNSRYDRGYQSAIDPRKTISRAKIDVFKLKINLRIGEERIIFKSVKPNSSLIKRVYMLSLREIMEFDLKARLIGETLLINRSLDPLNGDYIELNDLNEPFELRRNQGDDSMPTIEEGEVIEEFKTRDDELDTGIDDYPSCCDYDKKIHIDCAHNLKFSCMIGFEFTHVNFFPLLYVNVMSKKFYNSTMKDKMVYKGNNVIGALMNVPIFVGTFSVVMDFAVLEDMDAYRDEGMGDVIFGEPFLREAGIKARRSRVRRCSRSILVEFLVRYFIASCSTPSGILLRCDFRGVTLKVSDEDKKNGISHPYQKLKGFYKGVLNLGPDYIREAKMKEWLTRGHISVHEMEW